MNSSCFLGICAVASDPRGGGGNPVKPGLYVEIWAVFVIAVLMFAAGVFIAKKRVAGKKH